MKSVLIACGLLASSVSAHIQMASPYPIRSPLNKDAKGQKDYSYTNPLSSDGSDYPCKGFAKDKFESVAEYAPGSSHELELTGSAVHGGGSCQIGLSYDQGKTFRVIHSMLGGCPISKNYTFQIPEDAKAGEALLSWTWFNKIGNREMYMNCAQVTIKDGASREEITNMPEMPAMPDMPRMPKMPTFTRSLARRDGLDSLPEIFIANINGPGQCTTLEGQEVNFPQPGPSVEGSLSDKGYECKGSAPFLGDGSQSTKSDVSQSSTTASSQADSTGSQAPGSSSASPTSASPSSSSKAAASSSKAAQHFSKAKASSTKIAAHSSTPASSKPAHSSKAAVSSKVARSSHFHGISSSVATPSSTPLKSMATPSSKVASYFGTPSLDLTLPTGFNDKERTFQGHQYRCRDGSILCSPDGWHWALCDKGQPVNMGPVAPGTVCRHGRMVRAHPGV